MGLGYTGLPTAIVFAEHGLRVFGVDIKPEFVDSINKGEAPFVEAGLAEHLSAVVADGHLTAALTPEKADATIIAVPTPFNPDKTADLSYIHSAVQGLAPHLFPGALVILESTSPPGTSELVGVWISEARPDLLDDQGTLLVDVAHCPERVLPGHVLEELVSNDRIVGGLTPSATTRAKELYGIICKGEIHETDATTAEMAKCVENSFRDVNIAFANELSLICDNLGMDVWEVIELANHHPRVNILSPGPGVGGHCIAVDPWFIVAADPENSRLIRVSREVNDSKPGWVLAKVKASLGGHESPTIAALGLAFKPNIDDLRGSPAREVVESLSAQFPAGRILTVEPNITQLPPALSQMPNVELVDYETALNQADIVVLLVDHQEFLEEPKLREDVAIIDTRGTWR
jgi:UDP-N-acetyl-D-mannosaminuronic acid dehydrogenase